MRIALDAGKGGGVYIIYTYTSSHTLSCLFRQLGLPSSEVAIENFVQNNHLPKEIPLDHAACWSAGQAQFIRESLDEDSDWSEIVDQLDAMLRH